MSDTWTEIQEHKRRQESLRDRLQRRRRERQGIGGQDSDLSGLYDGTNLYGEPSALVLVTYERKAWPFFKVFT